MKLEEPSHGLLAGVAGENLALRVRNRWRCEGVEEGSEGVAGFTFDALHLE